MYGVAYKFWNPSIPSHCMGRSVEKGFSSRHGAKSHAGGEFHREDVQSVCVFDDAGNVHLYLRKDADGSIHREV